MSGAPPDKERSTTDYTADLVERLHDNHHIARQDLKVARDWMKACYDQLANSAGFQEGDRVWQYCCCLVWFEEHTATSRVLACQ